MAGGALIAESLRLGAVVEGVPLRVTKIAKVEAGDADAGQPTIWTFLELDFADDVAPALAEILTGALQEELGWYCDFRTADETFVVFSGRAFRYPRGDASGRAEAAAHARAKGVPEPQIDWPE